MNGHSYIEVDIMAKNKKDDILEAAYDLFLQYGYDNASVKMIAEQAGVAQGLLYNFYKSKELLFGDVLRMAYDRFRSKMIAVALNNKDIPPEEYLAIYADTIKENRKEARFLLSTSLMPKFRYRSEVILKEYSDGMIEMMKPLFPDVDDESLYNIGSLLLAISDSYIIDGDRERAIRTGVFAVNLFIESLNNS